MKTVFWTLIFFLDGEADCRRPGAVLAAIAALAVAALIVVGGRP